MARLRDSADDLRALIDATAQATEIRAAFVEKDFWVTEMLRSIVAPIPGAHGRPEPVQVIFKGGTSLSKAFKLIARFSEDVDILLDAPGLGKTVRDRVLKEIGRRAGADLQLPVTEREKDRGVKRNFEFEYRRAYASGVISARVRLEMGFRGGPNPHVERDISSYVAQHAATAFKVGAKDFDEFAPVRLSVLAPERTLVEKLMCLNTAASGDPSTSRDAAEPHRLVRHFYDVAQLLDSGDVRDRIAALAGGVDALATDVHERSIDAGFPTAPRPRDGFAASPAFTGTGKWIAEAGTAYARTLPSLVWGPCPTFEQCLATVAKFRDLL